MKERLFTLKKVRSRFFSNNFKTKLILSFIAVLVIPSIVIGLSAYMTAEDEIEKQILYSAGENVKLINSTINSTIEPKVNDVEYFSKNIHSQLYKGEESPEVRQKFNQYMGLHPEAVSIFVGTETGIFVQSPKKEMEADYDPRKRPWYQEAMKNKGEVIITEPYAAASTGDIVITVAKTTADGSGVVAVNLNLDRIKKVIEEVKVGKEGYAILLDGGRKYIAHPTMEAGTEAKDRFYDQLYQKDSGQFEYVFDGQKKKMHFATSELTGWKIAGTMLSSEVKEAAQPIFNKTILIVAVFFIIGGLLVYRVIKSIINPIKKLKEQVVRVSKGDLTEQIDIQSNDEIGQLGHAFNDMQGSLHSLIQNVEVSAEQVAASSEELTASAEQTSAATEQVATAIQEVAGSAEKQTDGIDKNVNSLNEISQGVSRIADNSTNVADLSKHMTIQAEEGGESVKRTMKQMNSIHESVTKSDSMIKSLYERSKEISTISDVISGISDQTNLLALNAAIEAARAGEHGKGFAVVADEVRKLAEQSQASAKQISELIKAIQQDTKNSVQIMGEVTDDVEAGLKISNETIQKFEQILVGMREMTPQIEEVSAAAQQISAGVQEVTSTANELAMIAKGNAVTSEEVAASTEEQLASMEEVSSSAQALSLMAEELKTLINKFKY